MSSHDGGPYPLAHHYRNDHHKTGRADMAEHYDTYGDDSNDDEQIDELHCIDDNGEDTCEGPVEFRMALSGTGRAFERCDYHWGTRLQEEERIRRDYPDSPCAPSWFDPMDAGERWDDDY